MGDSEKKSKASLDDITVEEMTAKTAKADKPAKETKKGKPHKKGFFSGVVAEFKKIVWPSRNSLLKQTTAVIVSSVILGGIIFLVDLLVKYGIDKLVQ